MPPIGTARRGRSCRVEGCLWAIEKTRAWCCCTFGAKTNVIDFGSGGTRIAIFLQDNWIFYTASEKKLVVYFHNRRCSARAHLDSRLSYRFALTCSGRQSPLSSEATPSTLSVLSGPRFSVVKPCSCSLVSSNSSSGEVAVVVVFVIICFVAASINSAGPWSDSHKSVTVATSQIHLHHIPRIPGL